MGYSTADLRYAYLAYSIYRERYGIESAFDTFSASELRDHLETLVSFGKRERYSAVDNMDDDDICRLGSLGRDFDSAVNSIMFKGKSRRAFQRIVDFFD